MNTAGQRWRQMRVHEVVRDGDEFRTAFPGIWIKCRSTIGTPITIANRMNFRTRRP